MLSEERSLQEDLEIGRDTTVWTVIALCAVQAMPDNVFLEAEKEHKPAMGSQQHLPFRLVKD